MENNTATVASSAKKARNIRLAKDALLITLKGVVVVSAIVGVSAVVHHFIHKNVVDDVIQSAVDAAGVV